MTTVLTDEAIGQRVGACFPSLSDIATVKKDP